MLDHSIQYSETIDVYKEVWEARCKEDYLERLKRAQCKILALNGETVAVSGCMGGFGL